MSLEIQDLAPLIQVFQMPTSIQFYRDKLGLTVKGSFPALSENPDDVNWCMLQLCDVELTLKTASEPESCPLVPDHDLFGRHADTHLCCSCPDVDAAFVFLRSQGLPVEPPKIAPYGMKQLYLTDPDGYFPCFPMGSLNFLIS